MEIEGWVDFLASASERDLRGPIVILTPVDDVSVDHAIAYCVSNVLAQRVDWRWDNDPHVIYEDREAGRYRRFLRRLPRPVRVAIQSELAGICDSTHIALSSAQYLIREDQFRNGFPTGIEYDPTFDEFVKRAQAIVGALRTEVSRACAAILAIGYDPIPIEWRDRPRKEPL